MGKMYALMADDKKHSRVTLKCDPPDGEVLVSQFESIVPGYHMNKRHWITITLGGDVSAGMIKDLSDKSYELVVNKLTKAEQKRLALIV